MKNKYFLVLFLSIFLYESSIIPKDHQGWEYVTILPKGFENVSVRLPNGQKKGVIQKNIERAGVL